MKINRCDCCGTETKDFIVIRFGADGFFYPAPTSEVCSKCKEELYKKSREFLTKFNNVVASEKRQAKDDEEEQNDET